MNWTAYMSFFITMAAVINPLGDLAIFIGLMAEHSQQDQQRAATQAGIAVFIILLLAIWIGTYFLEVFGISTSSFEAAGGMVLLLIGVSMINGNDNESGKSSTNINEKEDKALKKKSKAKSKSLGGVVPIAIPIAVGPGAIAACMIHAHAFHGVWHKLLLSGVCGLLAFMSASLFYFATFFSRVLGDSGIQIITRIMGMVLLAIALGMMAEGTVNMVKMYW